MKRIHAKSQSAVPYRHEKRPCTEVQGLVNIYSEIRFGHNVL
ncbi:hypothetical protein HMPREF1554_00359 [Porphyromonas gingivalis F0569]|nr:hypothetical protein HMPREF1554_00359 [Porphyromonas gingivalis F0569]